MDCFKTLKVKLYFLDGIIERREEGFLLQLEVFFFIPKFLYMPRILVQRSLTIKTTVSAEHILVLA